MSTSSTRVRVKFETKISKALHLANQELAPVAAFMVRGKRDSGKREYIRFVVDWKDEDSGVEQGIFQAAYRAQEWGNVTGTDAEEIEILREWFSENLKKPNSFGRSRFNLGICWFKPCANEHINRIWQMIRILERNGVYVKKIRTDKPGYVVYEDEWQLVAEPFREGTIPRR